MRRRIAVLALTLLLAPGAVRAAGLTFTQNLVADFEFNVLGGTPINGGGDTGFLPYEAVGALTFTLDASIDDPGQTTVPFTNVTGTLNGVLPTWLLPYTISPDVQFIGGDLTNIVRDGGGTIISADISNLSMRWDLIAGGGAVTLFTLDGLPFNGSTSAIPFSYGTVLSGPDLFNVYLNDGGTDILVAVGRNRTLTAVPEPGSAIPAGLALVGLGTVLARRRSHPISG